MSYFSRDLIFKNQIIIAILFVVILYFLFLIKDILVMIFIALILMSSLTPFVEFLKKKRLPKILSVIIPYFTTIILLFAFIFPLVPFFISQVSFLVERFPRYLEQAFEVLNINANSFDIQSIITSQLRSIGENALALSSKIFSSFFSLLTILILTFYFLLNQEKIKNSLINLFPASKQKKALSTFSQVEDKLGAWFRGQVILSLFIGVLTWVALTILGFDFALPLAVIAGILEIIPTIGPILSAVPTIIVALNISPTMALIVIIVYIAIQAIEANVLVPLVMQHAVGFNPIIIILAIIIGGKLMGIEGALLSIPFLSMLVVLKNSLTSRS